MRIFKRLLIVVLIFSITVVGLPFAASAEEKSDYIYLSDIYYAYPSYISKSQVLDTYTDDTLEILYLTLDHYLNSDSFTDSEIKTIFINNPANIKDYVQMFLSGYFGANYVKDDAIDLANELFLQNMFNTNSVEGANLATDMGDKVLKICEAIEGFTEEVEGAGLTDVEVLQKSVEHLEKSGVLEEINSSHIGSFLSELIPNLKTASGIATLGGDMIALGKTIMIAMMLEDTRLDVVRSALKVATPDTTFYIGMSRLESDITSGFGNYIFSNYVVNGLLEKIEDLLIDKLLEVSLGSVSAIVAAVGIIFEIAGYVVFPDTPDLNQIMLQMVLTDYVSGMQNAVYTFDNKFDGDLFTAKDITTHKSLMLSLKTLTDLALEQTEPLAVVGSDLNTINTLQNRYNSNYDLYGTVMNDVRRIISNIPTAERKRAYHEAWHLYEDTVVSYGSDTVTDNKLYLTDGVFNGSVRFYETLEIPEGITATINGSITDSSGGYIKLLNKGNLTVKENLSLKWFDNYGTTTVGNNFHCSQFSNFEGATLKLGGYYYVRESSPTYDGTIILNGTEQQEVERLYTKNLYVYNKAGIKYGNNNIVVTGEYFLNGNPLDNNGHDTVAASSNVVFDSISDYKSIQIGADLEIANDITAENIYVSGYSTLTIPEKAAVTINGNLILYSHHSKLLNNGYLKVTKNFNCTNYSYINNNGVLNISGDVNSFYFMDSENAITNIEGNFKVGRDVYANINGSVTVKGNAEIERLIMDTEQASLSVAGNIDVTISDITNGTIVLNGTEKQEVSLNKLNNLEVYNPSGIKYNNDIYVTGHYLLNGAPLDNNGYFTVYDGVTCSTEDMFDTISDYKDIRFFRYCNITLNSKITASIEIDYHSVVIVEENTSAQVVGNIKILSRSRVYNNGELTVSGDVIDIDNQGQLILNGTNLQEVSINNISGEIIINNNSAEGVAFNSIIKPSLFNHNGNRFSLYNNGYGSIFADYDGDKVTDEKDDDPTVFSDKNYCETICDITGDGKTNVLDFISIMKAATGGIISDVNLDGIADTNDIVYVKKVLLGIYVLPMAK